MIYSGKDDNSSGDTFPPVSTMTTVFSVSFLSIFWWRKAARAAAPDGSSTRPLLKASLVVWRIWCSVTVTTPSQNSLTWWKQFGPAKGGARPAATLRAELSLTGWPAWHHSPPLRVRDPELADTSWGLSCHKDTGQGSFLNFLLCLWGIREPLSCNNNTPKDKK